MFGSFALVLIRGLLILSRGSSSITGPPPPPELLPEPPGRAPRFKKKIKMKKKVKRGRIFNWQKEREGVMHRWGWMKQTQ